MPLRDYRELKVWQAAMELAMETYSVASRLPATERYGLSSQLQRAAISFPSNIAEGHSRGSTRDYLRFLSIAMGSLAELETQLFLAERLEYLRSPELEPVLSRAGEVGRMLRRLQQSLKSRVTSDDV